MKNKLREYREAAGLSQAELSEKSGVARAVISFLETEKERDVKVGTLIALSDTLGKPVEDIFLLK